ncbi:peptidase S8 and S53 subtilisin kexin sedolisin [Amycolatopsis alba DSM 44262]|uniref:Peptidase S8 and S53 subtilisin kexin sedolisin n=1 Tax=Amycolatopsis alba DSM 44262 TaxID=1125972 RepID=A0A229RD92_AMYAL|nr:peptidase S8 and S53 subtilisin kexin sedolisin [Amycolatopsis alba DSM 44262]
MACATLTLLANGGLAAAQDTELPQIPQTLKAGQACTSPSGKKVPSVPWQLPYLGVDRLWALSKGEGVTVGVVDTGVDKAVLPVQQVGDAGTDCVGHGTVVASLIAAPLVDGAKVSGLAPGARVLAVRGTEKTGAATAASIASALDGAVAAGARIICVATAVTEAGPALQAAVDRAVAAGALIVAAAGRDATKASDVPPWPYYPAAFPGVLAVSALGPDGKPDAKAVPGSLAAPGNLVVGLGPGGGAAVGAGPAFAAAHVAAAAALIRSYRPETTAADVARRLRDTAYPHAGVTVLDPLAALTSVASGVGAEAPARREPVAVTPGADPGPARQAAWAVVVGVVVAVALLGAAAVVVPRGRRRGWRAGPRGS